MRRRLLPEAAIGVSSTEMPSCSSSLSDKRSITVSSLNRLFVVEGLDTFRPVLLVVLLVVVAAIVFVEAVDAGVRLRLLPLLVDTLVEDFFGSSWSFASGEEQVEKLLARMGSTNTSTPTSPTPTGNNNSTLDIIRDFTRGIKRDQSLFPKLKDEAKWDSYNRNLSAQCRAQGVANILDAAYTPATPEETTLFRYHQL